MHSCTHKQNKKTALTFERPASVHRTHCHRPGEYGSGTECRAICPGHSPAHTINTPSTTHHVQHAQFIQDYPTMQGHVGFTHHSPTSISRQATIKYSSINV